MSLWADPERADGQGECPIDLERVRFWLNAVPDLALGGRRPSPDELAAHLAQWWLPDEAILYIGMAGTSLRQRVGDYYATELGDLRPHRGGYWLKTLSVLAETYVHYAETGSVAPELVEVRMLRHFMVNTSSESASRTPEGLLALPWANLEVERSHAIEKPCRSRAR